MAINSRRGTVGFKEWLAVNETVKSFEDLRSLVPNWPDYVAQDLLYKGWQKRPEQTEMFIRQYFEEAFGVAPAKVRWKNSLIPITINIFEPNSRQIIEQRMAGEVMQGAENDLERHATQEKLLADGPSKEPIIMCRTSKGWALMEGFHRTCASLKKWPNGYKQNAWWFKGGV